MVGIKAPGYSMTSTGHLKHTASGFVLEEIDIGVFALKLADFKGHWRISQTNTPAVGHTAHGHWLKDGIVWWVKGRVTDVHRDKTFYIVTGEDMATAETYWGRDVENGTKPALGFRVIDFPVFLTVRPREEDLPEAYPLKATEFVPEPSGVPNVGDLMMGYWIRDGVVHWTPGVVDKVERNKRFLIVEKGSMETFTGRDPKNGTKPALGFR
ncbi:hypothetical protein BJX62DRAFT_236510 [Aspergillus germanicus]